MAIVACDGGKKARLTRESTKETVKTIAQGRPGVSGKPVVCLLVCFSIPHARPWVCSGTRLSLHPSLGVFGQTSGAIASRDCVPLCLAL